MRHTRLVPITESLCITLLLASCALLDTLHPALSRAALVFIAEIETLLLDYERAAIPDEPRLSSFAEFSTSQDALYRNISTRLRAPPSGIPDKIVLQYRSRLKSAELRSSRIRPWPSLNLAPP